VRTGNSDEENEENEENEEKSGNEGKGKNMDRLCELRCIRYEMLKRDIPTGKFSPFSPEKTASYKKCIFAYCIFL